MEKKKNSVIEHEETAHEESVEEKKLYYIVNPAGAIHTCDRDHARLRLTQKGYRLATPDECTELQRRNGHQVYDHPIVSAT